MSAFLAEVVELPAYDVELRRAPEDGAYWFDVVSFGRPKRGDGWFTTREEALAEAARVAGPRLYPVRRDRSAAPRKPSGKIPALTFTLDAPPPARWLPLVDLEASDVEWLTGEHRRACLAEMAACMFAIEDGEIVSIDPAHGIQTTEVAA